MHGPALSDSERVREALEQEILTGALRAGTALTEPGVAGRYGVSRTPAREALRRLEHDQLLHRSGRRLVVRRLSADEISDLYEVRGLLEGGAAVAAAERRTAADLARLRRNHEVMADYGERDVRRRIELNRSFHAAVWRASHNGALVDLLSRVYLNVVRYTTLLEPGRWEAAIHEHEDILHAIVAGDPDSARQRMLDHLGAGRDICLRLHALDT